MERLHHMKESLMAQIQAQMGHLENVDTKELGEAIDMIKDLEEAIYYATITKAMEEKPLQQHGGGQQQQQQYMPMPQYNEGQSGRSYGGGMMYDNGMSSNGMMYNNGSSSGGGSNYASGGTNYARGGNSSNSGGGRSYMHDMDYGAMGMNQQHERDAREGVSPMYRKMYMESKEMKHDKAKQMKDLENYVQELSNDIVEMVAEASPEERQMLHQKICLLATKIK